MAKQTQTTTIQRRTIGAPIPEGPDLPSLFRLAEDLIPSGMLPDHLRNPGAVVATILAGQELGLGAMSSLRAIHLVKGRVVIGADAQLALLHRAGIRSHWIEMSDSIAVLDLCAAGRDSGRFQYTIKQARNAGLAGKQNWRNHPAAMLRARTVSLAARAYAPEVLMGVYTPDEAAEIDPARYPAPEMVEALPMAPQATDQGHREPEPEPEPEISEWLEDGHHRTWENDRRWFCARLGELGWKYPDLCAFIEWNGGKKRPSAMNPTQRRKILGRLTDPGPLLQGSITEWTRSITTEATEATPDPEPDRAA